MSDKPKLLTDEELDAIEERVGENDASRLALAVNTLRLIKDILLRRSREAALQARIDELEAKVASLTDALDRERYPRFHDVDQYYKEEK